MDSDRHHCADQILEAIEYGQLSKEEIERRLNKIIDDELSEPVDADYDATKVELCNSLLWQLRTHGRVKMQLPSDQARDRIKSGSNYATTSETKQVGKKLLSQTMQIETLPQREYDPPGDRRAVQAAQKERNFPQKKQDSENRVMPERLRSLRRRS